MPGLTQLVSRAGLCSATSIGMARWASVSATARSRSSSSRPWSGVVIKPLNPSTSAPALRDMQVTRCGRVLRPRLRCKVFHMIAYNAICDIRRRRPPRGTFAMGICFGSRRQRVSAFKRHAARWPKWPTPNRISADRLLKWSALPRLDRCSLTWRPVSG